MPPPIILPGNHHSNYSMATQLLVSFAMGAASTSLFFYYHRRKREDDSNDTSPPYPSTCRRRDRHFVKIASGDDDVQEHDEEKAALNWQPIKMENLTSSSRIEELPARKHHPWPWQHHQRKSSNESSSPDTTTSAIPDKFGFHRTSSDLQRVKMKLLYDDYEMSDQDRDATDNNTEPSASSSHNKQSEYCIGSIFGLDVGGTLAKLVYFEERAEDATSDYKTDGTMSSTSNDTPVPSPVPAARSLQRQRQSSPSPRRGSSSQRSLASAPPKIKKTTSSDYFVRLQNSTKSNTVTFASDCSAVAVSRNARPDSPPPARWNMRPRRSAVSVNTALLPDDNEARASPSIFRHPHHHAWHYARGDSQDDLDLYHQQQRLLHSSSSSILANAMPHELPSFKPCHSMHAVPLATANNGADHPDSSVNNMRKSCSMLDLASERRKAQALNRFYTFAKRLDSYRQGILDHKLSFYSQRLGGEFHFIRFETRRMQNAMDLIKNHNLHRNIYTMGATGGGAHKYAAVWRDELGVEMDRQDELDSLVAGMQFVLSTVVGECYSFRPQHRKHKDQRDAGDGRNGQQRCGDDNDAGGDDDNDDGGDDDYAGNMDNHEDCAMKLSSRSRSSSMSPDSYQQSNSPTLSGADYVALDEASSSSSDDNEEEADDVASTHGNVAERRHVLTETERAANVSGQKSDDWWWSRRVQRDAISYAGTYPYMLVTIGTGVSILRVDGPRQHERISGSTIGGGTYLGLMRLLTDVDTFEDVMTLAAHGDPSKVDMLVGDIYGDKSDALEKLGLPANLVASSFGKLVSKDDPASGLKQEDLARALLLMVTNNIGQVAYLNAKLHHTSRIYFVGNFLRENKISQRRLAYAIDYWSKGEMEALFLKHEGYYGALGAFLLSQNIPHNDLPSPPLSAQDDAGPTRLVPDWKLYHRSNKSMSAINI